MREAKMASTTVAILFVSLLGFACLSEAQMTGQCSEECMKYFLDSPSGPRVLRLFKELMMPDSPGAQKTLMEVNGQNYGLTATKKNLVRNAMKKGVREDLIEKMFDYAAILPNENDTTEATTYEETSTMMPSTGYPTTTTITTTTSVFPEIITFSAETTTMDTASNSTDSLERESTDIPNSPRMIPTTTTTTTETPETETPEPEVYSPPRYNISTKENGDVILSINGTDLKMPEELTKLNQLIKDKQLLSQIVDNLKNVGVPISNQGTRVSVGPEHVPEESVHVRIFTSETGPFKVQITSGSRGYELPGDDTAFNKFLSNRPQIAYQILSLLALHRVVATVDQNGRFYLPGVPVKPVLSTHHGFPLFQARAPKSINIGRHQFNFPQDWETVQRGVQSQVIPAAEVQRALENNNVDCPPRIVAIILGQMTRDFDRLVQPERHGNRVYMRVGSIRVQLPSEAFALANAMRQNLIAQQFVRHSLMTLGVESQKRDGGLQVTLPDKQDCFLPDVPTFRIFDYKVTPQPDGTVHISCGPDVYMLPRDRPQLQNAFESRKVLPLELVDALNRSGIPAQMNYATQDVTVEGKDFKLSFPIKMKTGAPARLNLYTQGRPGSMTFLVEVDDERFSLPKDVNKINDLIRSNVVDPLRLIELIKQRTYVPYHFDTSKGRHVVELNGKPIELLHSSMLNDRKTSRRRTNDSSEEDSDERRDG